MYAMICSRPDLSFATSLVSRYMSQPGKNNWESLKWILRYLKDTTKLGLVYEKSGENADGVIGYVDADYVGCVDTRSSLTGYAFK